MKKCWFYSTLFLMVKYIHMEVFIMRKDIMEAINIMKKNEAKPNYAELARIYNCDYRVIKRYFENEIKERAKVVCPSLLDDYKNIINDKVDLGYSAKSIYYLLTKKGFKGKYGIVKKYCREHINEEIKSHNSL